MTHPVLLLVLAVVVQSGACPTMCTCRNYPQIKTPTMTISDLYFTSVACDGYSDNITQQLSDATRDFAITNVNNIELHAIIDDLLNEEIRLVHLSHLKFTHISDIDNLLNSTFNSGFNKIQSIDLSSNKIDNFPEMFFNLTSLESMDLSNNTLKVIENQPFRTLRTLEVLNLSANVLNTIDSNSFSGLIDLKCLDLSENKLTTIGDKVLFPLSALQYLNLSGNRLEVLNEKCFSNLLKLQQLDVSWNRLARVAPGSLELPSLARLLLAGNPKLGGSREPTLLVGTGRRLQTVDASRTGLQQVPAALTHSIRTLRLAGNSIHTVQSGDLDSYPLLQILDFMSNQLTFIEDDALGRLESLTILYLTDNNIKDIPKSLPEHLKILHLKHNHIRKVQSKDLQELTVLEVLLLNNNQIEVVEEEAFSNLVSLITLDLSRNPIKILQAGYLAGPLALQVLRLSDLEVVSPAKEVSFPLSTTEHLTTLDLSKSPGLARQLLADTAALASSKELQELDMSYTNLEFIRSDLLHFLPQLRVLRIHGNYINCTELQWLAFWMRRQDDDEYKKITCSSPRELWGTSLVDLQEDENLIDYHHETATVSSSGVIEEKLFRNQNAHNNNNNLTDTAYNIKEAAVVATTSESDEILLEVTSTVNYEEDIKSSSIREEDKLIISTDASHFEANANETGESHNNQLDHESVSSEISYDLFSATTREETTFNEPTTHATKSHNINNNKMNELSTENDNVLNSTHQWNAMLSTVDQDTRTSTLLHPSMLILMIGVLGVSAALAMLASRFVRKRRHSRQFQQNDFEASSLPSVSELW